MSERKGASRARRTSGSLTTIETESDLHQGIRALRRKCPVLRKVHDATGLPPLRRRPPGFEGLARIVVGQQVSVASAAAIWGRCETVITPMTAETVVRLSDDDLRSAGLSRPKVRTLRAVAAAVQSRSLMLEDFSDHTDAEVRAALISVSGVGPWTADLFLLACLGRPDVFAAGDLALQVAAQHAFELDDRPTADEVLSMAEAWRPWRAVAARLLWSYYQIIKDQKSGIPI